MLKAVIKCSLFEYEIKEAATNICRILDTIMQCRKLHTGVKFAVSMESHVKNTDCYELVYCGSDMIGMS
jgi:hypothetical protein